MNVRKESIDGPNSVCNGWSNINNTTGDRSEEGFGHLAPYTDPSQPDDLEDVDKISAVWATAKACIVKAVKQGVDGGKIVLGWTVERSESVYNTMKNHSIVQGYANVNRSSLGNAVDLGFIYSKFWINAALSARSAVRSTCATTQPAASVANADCVVMRALFSKLVLLHHTNKETIKDLPPHGYSIPEGDDFALITGAVAISRTFSESVNHFADYCSMIGMTL